MSCMLICWQVVFTITIAVFFHMGRFQLFIIQIIYWQQFNSLIILSVNHHCSHVTYCAAKTTGWLTGLLCFVNTLDLPWLRPLHVLDMTMFYVMPFHSVFFTVCENIFQSKFKWITDFCGRLTWRHTPTHFNLLWWAPVLSRQKDYKWTAHTIFSIFTAFGPLLWATCLVTVSASL